MVTKTVTITEEAYDLLSRQKKKSESFSKTLTRILKKKGSILDLAGAWKDMPEEIAEKMHHEIRRLRTHWAKRSDERS